MCLIKLVFLFYDFACALVMNDNFLRTDEIKKKLTSSDAVAYRSKRTFYDLSSLTGKTVELGHAHPDFH